MTKVLVWLTVAIDVGVGLKEGIIWSFLRSLFVVACDYTCLPLHLVLKFRGFVSYIVLITSIVLVAFFCWEPMPAPETARFDYISAFISML